MDDDEILQRLKSICRLDMDALHAYMIAYDHIGHGDIRNTLLKFQADHGGHIEDLSELIHSLGGEPPEETGEFRCMRKVAGTEDALKVLLAGEELTVKSFGAAAGLDFPAPVLALIKRNLNDELRHLNYINHVLDARAWTKAA